MTSSAVALDEQVEVRIKSPASRRSLKRTILWAGVTIGFVVLVALVLVVTNLGDRVYVLSRTARISPDAVAATRTPAVVCVGNGGQLESSEVLAHALGVDGDAPGARVICRVPSVAPAMGYRTDVISSYQPRRMHGYVWLERHPELTAQCEAQTATVIDVPEETLTGYRSAAPNEWPCFRPEPHASLGYAIAFRSFFSSDTEAAIIDVIRDGYARQSRADTGSKSVGD